MNTLRSLLAALISAPTIWIGLASPAAAADPPSAIALRDGQHDFDFEIGTWKTT